MELVRHWMIYQINLWRIDWNWRAMLTTQRASLHRALRSDATSKNCSARHCSHDPTTRAAWHALIQKFIQPINLKKIPATQLLSYSGSWLRRFKTSMPDAFNVASRISNSLNFSWASTPYLSKTFASFQGLGLLGQMPATIQYLGGFH